MKHEDLRDVLKIGSLPKDVAKEYLSLYVGDIDWDPPLKAVFGTLVKKFGAEAARDKLRQSVSCAILLPAFDRSTQIDPENPQNLLLRVPYYQQLDQKDWFQELQAVVRTDAAIEGWRILALGLGFIDRIKYDPVSRQAFNWLYAEAERSGDLREANKDDLAARFTNLVKAYGGVAICNVFSRHASALKKVVNWRTGYFFQHALFDVYTSEQILKIKKAELEQANPKLVKKFLVGA